MPSAPLVITAVDSASESAEREEAQYSLLWRMAAGIFQPEELERLVPRQRAARNEAGGEGVSLLDPIAFTEAVAYEFLARGGKQARPFITLATYTALAETVGLAGAGPLLVPDHVKRVALSIETFHKASLVHDDIEDEDEFRYGQPTLHRRYGIASAINVGDYLIGLGYRLVSRDAALHGGEVAAQLLDILAAAHQRLCEGQGAELFWRDASNKQLSPSDAVKIYALKTSPAFEAALLCGACLQGSLATHAEPFRRFAKHVGIAFQILNDLKDWNPDESNKKTVGGDLIGGRPTVLWAIALERLPSAAQAELLSLAGDRQLCDSARMDRARVLYMQGDVFRAARDMVFEQRLAASKVADELPEGAMRRLLKYIIETVLNRPHELELGLPQLPS
ncbi:MAG: polyprenyl synthetase family protein [Blastopirellula sp.]|nr:polyprenyl synthetase family protein [Blastopirellula sp.]